MSLRQAFIHSHRYQLILWFAALALVALGIYLTKIRFMDAEWLSRSGCAVVMLGIWSGLGVIIQERLLLGQLRWRRRNALIKARADLEEKETEPSELEGKIEEIHQAFEKQSANLVERLKMSLGVLEVSLLLTGTFLWGFGDLFIT